MRIELYGLTFECPGVTFYLWSPWRASALEHRLFEAVCKDLGLQPEKDVDESRFKLSETKAWKTAVHTMERVLKGWQEDATDGGSERRLWRWLLEADTDADGYDHHGDRSSVWAFLQLGLERNSPGADEERAELLDLNGFGFRLWNADEKGE